MVYIRPNAGVVFSRYGNVALNELNFTENRKFRPLPKTRISGLTQGYLVFIGCCVSPIEQKPNPVNPIIL